ncbi:hypothetical protein [Levilactobacillus tongjiangensis]|uniref:Uncharacterized protein n=1 Tax=Levilactobacillus tongjiangensis TaxID=2486023 RepID=A0ABW1SQI8_9LACO|nr:hypothetical protein [Levilactobacillus tongjiangensis]
MSKHQVPMWLLGLVGLVVSAFCILGYLINEEAISAQAAQPLNNWVWGITTIFALVFTVGSFLKRKRLAAVSLLVMIIGMVVYFGFLN